MHRSVLTTGVAVASLIGLFAAAPSRAQPRLDESNFIAEYAARIGVAVVSGKVTSVLTLRDVTVVWGEGSIVDDSPIQTWAILSNADDSILAVGVTFGMGIVHNMPAPGEGPAGAFASLQFPEVVQDNTYFQHVEIQPVPLGHMTSPTACNTTRNSVPHFDFHFYSIPEADVFKIPAGPPSPDVDEKLLPDGYPQPGASLPQMGRHSAPSSLARRSDDPDYCDSDDTESPHYLGTARSDLIADMIAGFLPDASKMHFIEPMISQERLLQRVGFELATPAPKDGAALHAWAQSFGRSMLYPQTFETRFLGNSCTMIFSDFISVQ